MDDYSRKLGTRVREARVATGLSQTEFADRMGLTRSSIANIEAGRQRRLGRAERDQLRRTGRDLRAAADSLDAFAVAAP